ASLLQSAFAIGKYDDHDDMMASLHTPALPAIFATLFVLPLLLPLASSGHAPAVFEPSHAAAQLGETNFTATLGVKDTNQPCLVEFYASWCPACKHFAPTFEKLASFLKGQSFGGRPLYIARVDCATEVKLCGEFELTGYPSLLMGQAQDFATKQHKKLSLFQGPRDLPVLTAWVGRYFNMTLTYSAVPTTSTTGPAETSSSSNSRGSEGAPAENTKRRPLPQGPVWSVADVEGATLQLWRIVVTTPLLHRGPEKRTALQEVLSVWAAAHPSSSCKTHAARLLGSYDTLWPPAEQEAPAALLMAEPCGPAAGLAYRGEWESCRGSQPDSRGYSCGLWEMLHTLALRLPEQGGRGGPAATMMAFLLQFNKHFFLCEPCQKHFGRILTSPEAAAVRDRRSLVMWLWRVHNEVNQRLRGVESKYGHSTTGDPEFPKEQWPAPETCPTCRNADGVWVEEQVWAYLQRAYGPGSAPGADSTAAGRPGQLLHARTTFVAASW
ncbi:hypothetical protein Agub_g2658, partial [Astrephomene gubernaculifera]